MRVLIFMKYYLPAYKAGGPIRTIQGMVDYLGSDIEFSIVAQDRDFGDAAPFPDVEVGCWTKVGNARVCYVPKVTSSLIAPLVFSESWDILYLQSFFSAAYSTWPLWWWKRGKLKAGNVLLAPRGQFSQSAISKKSVKKRAFMAFARALRLYHSIDWHASSNMEKEDILREIGYCATADRIGVALDIPPRYSEELLAKTSPRTVSDRLQIVFLSRITRHKNLSYALEVLSKLSFPIDFNIYGPIDRDSEYWESCREMIEELPPNVRVQYHGPVPPQEVPAIFARHDLFLFPTHSENFGHVILESLNAGCPVLTSDQTPWQDLDDRRVGWSLPLANNSKWHHVITNLAQLSVAERDAQRAACRIHAQDFLKRSGAVEQNLKMLECLRRGL